jgi:uncharacterized protein (DUF1499 family)
LGVNDGRLTDCPHRPNCVSTQAADGEHRIEPIELTLPADKAGQRIEATLKSMPRMRIVSSQNSYLHAEFRSLLLGFVDDVEFAIDEPTGLIHFRSAARIGHSDLGVNRHRMEEIRSKLEAHASN